EPGLALVHTELVEGRLLGLLDRATGHLHPFHRSPASSPFLAPPAALLGPRPRAASARLGAAASLDPRVAGPGPGRGRGRAGGLGGSRLVRGPPPRRGAPGAFPAP